ncbi:mitochondrial sodium/hydrogen exchanger 9B2-like [Arapaima gigas]
MLPPGLAHFLAAFFSLSPRTWVQVRCYPQATCPCVPVGPPPSVSDSGDPESDAGWPGLVVSHRAVPHPPLCRTEADFWPLHIIAGLIMDSAQVKTVAKHPESFGEAEEPSVPGGNGGRTEESAGGPKLCWSCLRPPRGTFAYILTKGIPQNHLRPRTFYIST